MIKTFEEYRELATGEIFTKEMFDKEEATDGRHTLHYNKYVLAHAQELVEEKTKKVEMTEFLYDAIDTLGEQRVIECYKAGLSNETALKKGVMNPMVRSELEHALRTEKGKK
jgi:hypothetical protein